MIETIRSVYATHVGNIRDHNEDRYRLEPELGLWIVADGMGGHEGGEIASEMTVDVITRSIEDGESLKQSLVSAHEAVLHAAQSDPRKSGMGSTVVVLRIRDNRFEIAWVGDSRAYRLSKRYGFKLLTHDHSYIQLMIDNGLIAPHQARNHPMGHVVSQAIGSSPQGSVCVDFIEGTVEAGDRFLLCTDGLTNELTDDRIAAVLNQGKSLQTVVEILLGKALDAGGLDNITIVAVEKPA
ncbi:MAG: PP2C family protein-serine/threonine phosphatase [Methylococcales bacterium]